MSEYNTTRAAKITRRDGEQLRIVELDVDVTIDAEVYTSIPAVFSDSESSESLTPDNAELTDFYDQLGMTPDATKRGLFSGATIEVIEYDFVNHTVVRRDNYVVGEVKASDTDVNIELKQDASTKLEAKITDVVTKDCRHKFGGPKCGIDKELHRFSGAFTTGADLIDTASGKVDGYYDSGELKITSGQNAGTTVDIVSFAGSQFYILGEFPYPVADGDAYDVWRGCGGTEAECNGYANFPAYGGFLHVPTQDELLAGGDK